MPSRIILSGEIATAEAVDLLVAAISADNAFARRGFGSGLEQDILERLLEAEGSPLVIEGHFSGDRTFAHIRSTCERIGMAFVFEIPTFEGMSSTVFDPDEVTYHSEFSYEGKADAPVMTINQMADFAAMTDEEIGMSMRRTLQKLERGVHLARAIVVVSAEARVRLESASAAAPYSAPAP